ncbi:MAG: hypothetical protein Q9207_007267, partial [Kuettlingeria erythrocarpa]
MSDLSHRLSALHPTIEDLMNIAGTAGLSLGVIHNGEVVHNANFGFRDVRSKFPVNDQTIFSGCSLTKAMVSATIGKLVAEDALTWDTKVKDVLPEFQISDDALHNFSTITDLLAHRTGMSTSNYWLGSQNNILVSKEDSMKFLNSQEAVKPFRGQWQYNNLGYELAGHVIEKISGQRWDEVLASNILEPLGLTRTSAMKDERDDNIAKAYTVLDDGTPVEIDGVKAAANKFGGANGGIRSCVKDLLKLYQAILKAAEHQFSTGKVTTPGTPLDETAALLSSKIPLKMTSLRENSYALGWVRSQLPNSMGAVGLNPKLMSNDMPVVAKGASSPPLVIYHQGSLPGALAAVNLLPESQSAIVVMTNTLALNDCADWVGQLVLETILNVRDKNDYLDMARKSVAASLDWHHNVQAELDKDRIASTTPRDFEEHIGTYKNSPMTMKIEVTQQEGKLFFALQGLESEKYELTHYHKDVFTWLRPRDELAARGRFTHQKALYYKIRFDVGLSRKTIDTLSWAHDADIPDGETFYKDGQSSDVPVPMIYGTAWKADRTGEFVTQALKAGLRCIDTACQPGHYREDLVGDAVRNCIETGVITRKEIYLQTKFTPPSGQDPASCPYDPSSSIKSQVQASIGLSLSNLRPHRSIHLASETFSN